MKEIICRMKKKINDQRHNYTELIYIEEYIVIMKLYLTISVCSLIVISSIIFYENLYAVYIITDIYPTLYDILKGSVFVSAIRHFVSCYTLTISEHKTVKFKCICSVVLTSRPSMAAGGHSNIGPLLICKKYLGKHTHACCQCPEGGASMSPNDVLHLSDAEVVRDQEVGSVQTGRRHLFTYRLHAQLRPEGE